MKRWLAWLAVVALATGCIESKEDYVLNPDGSGKVTIHSKFQPMSFTVNGEETSPDKEMRDSIRQALEQAKGVDAWRDISFQRLDDGRLEFQGVAYFRDLNRFKLASLTVSLNKPVLSKDGQGNAVLELQPEKRTQHVAKPPATPLSEQALMEKVRVERGKWNRSRAVMAGFVEHLRRELTFKLPGKITKSSNFQRVDDQTVIVVAEGKKMLAVMDEFASDEKWWREQVAQGINPQEEGPSGDLFNEKMYGQRGPIRVVFHPQSQPVFDYAVEVATAKREYPAMLQRLKLAGEGISAPTASGGELRRIRVGGIRLVQVADSARGVRPFFMEESLTLALIADLPQKVSDVTGGEVVTAVGDDGVDLLPARGFERKIRSAQLSQDKSTVVFEVNLTKPAKGVRGLKELAGKLEYIIAGVSSNVDLGISDLRGNAQGSVFGAILGPVKASRFRPGGEQVDLHVDLDRAAVKAIKFYDAKGAELATEDNGPSWSNGQTTFTFSLKGKFPETGRVILEKAEISKYEIPFQLKDIALFEAPTD